MSDEAEPSPFVPAEVHTPQPEQINRNPKKPPRPTHFKPETTATMATPHHTTVPLRKILVTGFLLAAACTTFTSTAQAAPLTLPGIGTIEIPSESPPPSLVPTEASGPAGAPDAPIPPSVSASPEQRALTYAETKLGAPYAWARPDLTPSIAPD